jgi:hypothetical protein
MIWNEMKIKISQQSSASGWDIVGGEMALGFLVGFSCRGCILVAIEVWDRIWFCIGFKVIPWKGTWKGETTQLLSVKV